MRLAEREGATILSVDSMQVYRGMDIGTAKPSPEDRARVPHEMIDLCDPDEEFSVAEFQSRARAVIDSVEGDVVIVGGSGLHFRAVVDPMVFDQTDPALRSALEGRPLDSVRAELLASDPRAGDHVDLANPRRVVRALEVLLLTGRSPSRRAADPRRRDVAEYRPSIPFRAVGIDPGDASGARIASRLGDMRSRGLLDEVRALRSRLGRTASQAVGYKELVPVVEGHVTEDEGFEAVRVATEALVKRQRTFFRPDPRIAWIDWTDSVDDVTARATSELELV